jgi:hypothetical protein
MKLNDIYSNVQKDIKVYNKLWEFLDNHFNKDYSKVTNEDAYNLIKDKFGDKKAELFTRISILRTLRRR